jgi:hypothetical protein
MTVEDKEMSTTVLTKTSPVHFTDGLQTNTRETLPVEATALAVAPTSFLSTLGSRNDKAAKGSSSHAKLARTAAIDPDAAAVVAPVLPAPAVGVRELLHKPHPVARVRGAALKLKPFALAAHHAAIAPRPPVAARILIPVPGTAPSPAIVSSPAIVPPPVVVATGTIVNNELACTAGIDPDAAAVVAPVLPAPAVGVRELLHKPHAAVRIGGAALKLKPFALAAHYPVSERGRGTRHIQRDGECSKEHNVR